MNMFWPGSYEWAVEAEWTEGLQKLTHAVSDVHLRSVLKAKVCLQKKEKTCSFFDKNTPHVHNLSQEIKSYLGTIVIVSLFLCVQVLS